MWAIATLLCLIAQGFFSMQEMAIISINRLEVLYFALCDGSDVKRYKKRALQIAYLLDHPHILFTTTLVIVNFALQLGSECSRRFYASLELSSNWAPVTQILVVVIVAELAPMFASRYWPRPISFMGAGVIFFTAKILTPFTRIIGEITSLLQRALKLVGIDVAMETKLFEREEFAAIFQRFDQGEASPLDSLAAKVSSQLLQCKTKQAAELQTPLSRVQLLPESERVGYARRLFGHDTKIEYILVYQGVRTSICGVLFPRMLLGVDEALTLSQIARAPFYVGDSQSVFQWLIPFRSSRYPIAVVLDKAGNASGCFTFDDLADFLFMHAAHRGETKSLPIVEKLFDGNMTLAELKVEYSLDLSALSSDRRGGSYDQGSDPGGGCTICQSGAFTFPDSSLSNSSLKSSGVNSYTFRDISAEGEVSSPGTCEAVDVLDNFSERGRDALVGRLTRKLHDWLSLIRASIQQASYKFSGASHMNDAAYQHREGRRTLGHWASAQAKRPLREGDELTVGALKVQVIEMGWFKPKKLYIKSPGQSRAVAAEPAQ